MTPKSSIAVLLFAVAVPLACVTTGSAAPGVVVTQTRQDVQEDDEWCASSDEDAFCEVREFTLPADRGTIDVDASPNGGIRVESWERNEILVRAKVQARTRDDSDAEALAREVEISTSGAIRARGPRTGRGESWHVSYRLYVPRTSNLDLESVNGGIGINEIAGNIRFRTTNGGIHLSGVSGDVRGSTTNGGLHIELAGDSWDGSGLDVETVNGSVRIAVPEGYSAHLESGTVNGSMRFDFPVTFQGRVRRRIEVDLGEGGKTLRAVTTNGSVVVSRA